MGSRLQPLALAGAAIWVIKAFARGPPVALLLPRSRENPFSGALPDTPDLSNLTTTYR